MEMIESILEQIRSEVARLCGIVGLRTAVYFSPQQNGSPHIEFDGAEYHYVITERGRELERRRTPNRDELLYWLVSDATFESACSFELRNRVKGQDFRRLLFSKEIELMSAIKPAWGVKKRSEVQKVLESHPYRDNLS